MRYAKRCITIGIALFIIVGLRAGTGPAQKAYVIKLGHNSAVTHPVHLAATEFAKRVAERLEC